MYLGDFLKYYAYWVSVLVPLPSVYKRLPLTGLGDPLVFRKHDDVIEIDETPVEPKVTQTCFHQPLECAWGIH